MKNKLALLAASASNLTPQNVRLVLTLVALVLLVLGVGAPVDGSGGPK